MSSKNALLAIVVSVCAFVLASSCDLSGGSNNDPEPKTPAATYGWSALGSGVGVPGVLNSHVNALALDSSHNLYVGGCFTTVSGISTSTVAMWNGSAWSALGGGICPSGNDYAFQMIVDAAGNVYAGGFLDNDWPDCKGLVKLNGSSWNKFPSYPDDVTGIEGMALDPDGHLHVSFQQGYPDVGICGLVAEWNGSAWEATTIDSKKLNDYAHSIVFDAGRNLYAGGSFQRTEGGTTLNRVAKRASGSDVWTAVGTGFDSSVNVLICDAEGNIYAGGYFRSDSTGTKNFNYVAKWNGSEWTALGEGVDGEVRALAIGPDGTLYAGGAFSKGVVKWNGTAWEMLDWMSYFDDQVNALVCDADGTLYVGGMFSEIGSVKATHIAKWSKQ